jgi:hypothetical protein
MAGRYFSLRMPKSQNQGIAILNLFCEPTAFRTPAMMACLIALYRMVSGDSNTKQKTWAVLTGMMCFSAQMLRLAVKISYPIKSWFGRPSAIAVSVLRMGCEIQRGNLVAINGSGSFYTFLNLADSKSLGD